MGTDPRLAAVGVQGRADLHDARAELTVDGALKVPVSVQNHRYLDMLPGDPTAEESRSLGSDLGEDRIELGPRALGRADTEGPAPDRPQCPFGGIGVADD